MIINSGYVCTFIHRDRERQTNLMIEILMYILCTLFQYPHLTKGPTLYVSKQRIHLMKKSNICYHRIGKNSARKATKAFHLLTNCPKLCFWPCGLFCCVKNDVCQWQISLSYFLLLSYSPLLFSLPSDLEKKLGSKTFLKKRSIRYRADQVESILYHKNVFYFEKSYFLNN